MLVGAKPKKGRPISNRVATLYVIWRAVRVSLAMSYVLPEDSNREEIARQDLILVETH